MSVRLRFGSAAALCASLAAGCAAPPMDFQPREAQASLERRADTAELEDALALADVFAPSLALPEPAERAYPSQDGYWDARALAFSPAVRTARREWRAARAARSSAGAPRAIQVRSVDHQFAGEDELFESAALFDLLGHLGLGPSAAAKLEAGAGEAASLASFASVAWDARTQVAKARLALAAIRARRQAVLVLADEASSDLGRIEILQRTGRVGLAPARAAHGMVAALERRASVLAEMESVARAVLARAAGMTPDDPALEQPGAELLLHLSEGPLPAEPTGEGELRHPSLTEAHLEVALREARVRSAAAASWPGIGVGPHLSLPSGGLRDTIRVGGLFQVTLPLPSSWRGIMESRLELRAAAVEGYVDALVDLRSRARDAETRALEIQGRSGFTAAVHHAAEDAWISARAGFRVGRVDLNLWIQALERQGNAITMPIDDLEALALAALDLEWAAGPEAAR